jgi:nucleotide-binding universal stress UspA family protein
MTPIPAGWKLVEALRESLLWTASSLAAVGKEQDVITLEGRKRTIGEILDEANAALDAPSPASVAPGDAQKEAVMDALAQSLGSTAYFCTRVWQAWHVGTMSAEDFVPIAENSEALADAADAVLAAVAAPAAGDALPNFDIEAAAQKMAECMDYPWAYMAEQGRTHMRKSAQAVIDAALAAQQGKGGE